MDAATIAVAIFSITLGRWVRAMAVNVKPSISFGKHDCADKGYFLHGYGQKAEKCKDFGYLRLYGLLRTPAVNGEGVST